MTTVLTTERFELRPPAVGDLDGLIELIADEETRRFLGPGRGCDRQQGEQDEQQVAHGCAMMRRAR